MPNPTTLDLEGELLVADPRAEDTTVQGASDGTVVFERHWHERMDGTSECVWTEHPVVRVSRAFVWIFDVEYERRRRLGRAALESLGEVRVRIGRSYGRTLFGRRFDDATALEPAAIPTRPSFSVASVPNAIEPRPRTSWVLVLDPAV